MSCCAGGHDLGDLLGLVAILDDVAGEQADQLAGVVDDGKVRKEKAFLLLDHREHVADQLVGGDGDGVLDEAVDVALHAGDLLDLVLAGML
jgi:hypothetical protein